jgi:hypothetical protein
VAARPWKFESSRPHQFSIMDRDTLTQNSKRVKAGL